MKKRLVAVLLLVHAPVIWLRLASARDLSTVDDAPDAPVAVVFGAQLAPGGTRPMPFLAGRLDVAAELLRAGRVRAVLVSGDAHGGSGDEIAAMRGYLVDHGVAAERIVADPDGLDTYDTCRRAHDVYGVRRALLVSQSLHLPRAVTLCRARGIDAHGVAARCDGCMPQTVAYNNAREVPAAWKALYDVVSDRPPARTAPPTDAVDRALRG